MKKLTLFTLMVALTPAEPLDAATKNPSIKRAQEEAAPSKIFARLDGYGWMDRHPLTLLHAAYNNAVVPDNNKKISMFTLHQAVKNADLSTATTALKNNANPNKVDTKGWSPLHYACIDTRCTDIIKLMIMCRANIHKATKLDRAHPTLGYGYTPLHIAVENNNRSAVALLLTHGAIVTPEILAATKDRCILKMLQLAQLG